MATKNLISLDKKNVDALIIEEHFFHTQKTTVCILTLQSGFEIVGKSNCLNKSQFKKELGGYWAQEDAKNQLFKGEAYSATVDHARSINNSPQKP